MSRDDKEAKPNGKGGGGAIPESIGTGGPTDGRPALPYTALTVPTSLGKPGPPPFTPTSRYCFHPDFTGWSSNPLFAGAFLKTDSERRVRTRGLQRFGPQAWLVGRLQSAVDGF
jgi:hypothetical protein